MPLSKEDILGADDLGLLEVRVKEWKPKNWKEGDPIPTVFIRVMSVGERDAYENEWVLNKSKGVANFRAKFLQKVLCDENGELLFAPEEIESLANKSARVMNRLWQEAMKHNALSESDVEELAKN